MDDNALWVIALAAGAVVLLVVALLLFALYRYVRDIDTAVSSLDELGDGVAANTVKIRDLLTTASVLKQIRAEVRIHDDYLASQ
ncbi:MAG: hypothetical protein M3469_08055 [Actinomycetota bacterium]|nr:hypothetical protein [Actinomycetota bacterium]